MVWIGKAFEGLQKIFILVPILLHFDLENKIIVNIDLLDYNY
jgi:hypothetical protein